MLEEPPESPPHEARLADALVELVTRSEGSQQSPAATLVVHAGAEVLVRDEPATDRGWPRPSRASRWPRTRSATWAATPGSSGCSRQTAAPWGSAGGEGRSPNSSCGSSATETAERAGSPGCERKRWLHAHHLIHDGGATNLDNLVLQCHAHHRLIHEGGWRTGGHPARDLRFHDAGGRPVRTRPSEVRPEVRARYFP